MDSPQRKKARFSQHPQVFQYSSKSKKDNETDNDSLLIDNNDDDRTQPTALRVEERDELQSNTECQLHIEQLTSDLAQIEAYLQQQSKPIDRRQPNFHISSTPIKVSQNLQINLRDELRSGRQTMNIEQQIKVRSNIKEIKDDEISNNKKRAISEQSKLNDKSDKNVEQKLGEEIRRNNRITMDVKELMNILNEHNNDNEIKMKEERRKNRITMDVYSLAKFIEEGEAEEMATPIKSVRQNKVFSAFKESPHTTQVKLFVANYLADVGKRYQEKQQFSRKLQQQVNELKSELVKMDLRISDAKKRAEKKMEEKQSLERHLKVMTEELDKKKYLDDLKVIKKIEVDVGIKVLQCSVEETGCYGHFMFDGIFMKAKAKGKFHGIEIKLSASSEAKQKDKNNFISIEDGLKCLRKQSVRLQEKNQGFLQSVRQIRRGYARLSKLDNEIYYLSLNFDIKDLQLSSNCEKLSFQVIVGHRVYLLEINLGLYLNDDRDPNSVSIYDPSKPGYLKIDLNGKQFSSVVFQKMKLIVGCR